MTTDGGPAFPVPSNVIRLEGTTTLLSGMSLRDWFAGMALQGLLANGKPIVLEGVEIPYNEAAYAIACDMIRERNKYESADAMLEQRKK